MCHSLYSSSVTLGPNLSWNVKIKFPRKFYLPVFRFIYACRCIPCKSIQCSTFSKTARESKLPTVASVTFARRTRGPTETQNYGFCYDGRGYGEHAVNGLIVDRTIMKTSNNKIWWQFWNHSRVNCYCGQQACKITLRSQWPWRRLAANTIRDSGDEMTFDETVMRLNDERLYI
jgi:hypothetical protein